MALLPKRILIVNDGRDCGHSYTPLFSEFGDVTNDVTTLKLKPFEFRLVVFTGGSDMSPDLYGDTSPHKICSYDRSRDADEIGIFKFAQQRGLKMTGICRGMQFLNVMSGGKMVHHLNGHSNGTHLVMVKDRNEPFTANSYHHQMCIPHKDTHILGWSHEKLSDHYIGDRDEPMEYNGPEVESIYNSVYKFMGVQWHPEATMASGDSAFGRSWYKFLLKDFLNAPIDKFKNMYLGMEASKIYITEVNA